VIVVWRETEQFGGSRTRSRLKSGRGVFQSDLWCKDGGVVMGCRTRAFRICEEEGWGVPLEDGRRWLETILAPASL
jgi:hypothetical protein